MQELARLKQIGAGIVTTKQSQQSTQLPADTDLAVFAESTERGGGNSVGCTAALRFHSKRDKSDRIRYSSPQHWHRVACDMEVVELQGDKEVPVPSAHHAYASKPGWLKGGDLNVCATDSAHGVAPESEADADK